VLPEEDGGLTTAGSFMLGHLLARVAYPMLMYMYLPVLSIACRPLD